MEWVRQLWGHQLREIQAEQAARYILDQPGQELDSHYASQLPLQPERSERSTIGAAARMVPNTADPLTPSHPPTMNAASEPTSAISTQPTLNYYYFTNLDIENAAPGRSEQVPFEVVHTPIESASHAFNPHQAPNQLPPNSSRKTELQQGPNTISGKSGLTWSDDVAQTAAALTKYERGAMRPILDDAQRVPSQHVDGIHNTISQSGFFAKIESQSMHPYGTVEANAPTGGTARGHNLNPISLNPNQAIIAPSPAHSSQPSHPILTPSTETTAPRLSTSSYSHPSTATTPYTNLDYPSADPSLAAPEQLHSTPQPTSMANMPFASPVEFNSNDFTYHPYTVYNACSNEHCQCASGCKCEGCCSHEYHLNDSATLFIEDSAYDVGTRTGAQGFGT